MRATAVGVAMTLLGLRPAWAHGDVHRRIEVLDAQLAAGGPEAGRLVERGSLHATDQNWPAAVRDLEAAYDLDPELPGLEERLGNALLQVGEPERAVERLGELLAREPTRADARLVRARALARVGRSDEADAEFARAIELSAKPSPRMFLDRADALLEATPARIDDAIAALAAGAARLGPLVVFVERAQEIELERGRAAEALAWTDRLPDTVKAAPDWRLRRARIHQAAGHGEEAQRELEAAIVTIDALPQVRRETEALMALRAEVLLMQTTLDQTASRRSSSGWGWFAAGGIAALAAGHALLRRVRASRYPKIES